MLRYVCIIILSLLINNKVVAWNKVINAIAIIESNKNAKAVNGDQVGLLQIRPIVVKDCNRILKMRKVTKRYTLNDRLNPKKSKEMFIIYQGYYNPKKNIEHGIRLWNGGPNYSIKDTQEYYQKVRKVYKRK